jgi:hypothetical protein
MKRRASVLAAAALVAGAARELMDQVAREISNGRQLVQLTIHPKYSFAVGASTDNDKLHDSSWGFTIREFRLEGHR